MSSQTSEDTSVHDARSVGFVSGKSTIKDVAHGYHKLRKILGNLKPGGNARVKVYQHLELGHAQGTDACCREQFWLSRSSRARHYETHHPAVSQEALNCPAVLESVVSTRHDLNQSFRLRPVAEKPDSSMHHDIAEADDSDVEDKQILLAFERRRKKAKVMCEEARLQEEEATRGLEETKKKLEELVRKREESHTQYERYNNKIQAWQNFEAKWRKISQISQSTTSI